MGGGGLRDLVRRLGLECVDEIRELDPVLDEEHRHVVADQVVVALARVEVGGEPADVADGVGGAARAADGGKAANTGVSRPDSDRKSARVNSFIDSVQVKVPQAPAPRACTTSSGIRSWSKRVSFSRK
jgi:hypothetical protein